jgi:hypothetical protein
VELPRTRGLTEVLRSEFIVIKTWVELHDSEVLQVQRSDEGAALLLDAYVHRWEQGTKAGEAPAGPSQYDARSDTSCNCGNQQSCLLASRTAICMRRTLRPGT